MDTHAIVCRAEGSEYDSVFLTLNWIVRELTQSNSFDCQFMTWRQIDFSQLEQVCQFQKSILSYHAVVQ